MGNWFGWSEGGKQEIPAAVTALEQRMEALERTNRSMRLEWEDVYDRLMKAAARLNARSRRAAPDPIEEESSPATPEQPLSLGTHAMLKQARERRHGA